MKNVFYELYPCGHYFVQYGIFKFLSLCFSCILSVICFEFDAISKDLLTFVWSFMFSLISFSLYRNNLWKHNNRVIRNVLPRRLRVSLKNLIYKEKYERVTKEKFFFWKFQKYTMQQLYFGTLVLASYCYCGDNI